MNKGRRLHSMIKYDHKIFVFGSLHQTKSAERYNIIKDSWKNLPDMPEHGSYISSVRS